MLLKKHSLGSHAGVIYFLVINRKLLTHEWQLEYEWNSVEYCSTWKIVEYCRDAFFWVSGLGFRGGAVEIPPAVD